MCMKLTSGHIRPQYAAMHAHRTSVSGKVHRTRSDYAGRQTFHTDQSEINATTLSLPRACMQPFSCLFPAHYLSMYRICPSGFILSSTLGTVTYWNSPSLALGKYTWKSGNGDVKIRRRLFKNAHFNIEIEIHKCNTSGFHIAWTNLGSLRSRASLIA